MNGISFIEGIPDFKNPENKHTLVVLDDLMDSTFSKKVNECLPEDRTIAILA
jgi:hypothetical protein